MPFKSKAQMRKFFAMASRGEISKKRLKKWIKETRKKYGSLSRLPEKKR
jgi:hypothetical protein